MTALVIGSITPDFEYFMRMQQDSYYSHTWKGIFWFDLPLGLLLVYLFDIVVRKEVIKSLPKFLNRRFARFSYSARDLNNGKDFLFVLLSLLIGILSHLIWDKLTHRSVRLIDQEEHYNAFWEANSIAGAIVIAAVVLKMPAGNTIQQNNIFFYWLMVSVITLTVIYIRFLSTNGIRELGISAIVGFLSGLIIASLLQKTKK